MQRPMHSGKLKLAADPLPATYYVDSVSGNDANAGTSTGSAFASIDKINTLTLRPGDSVLFHSGEQFLGTLTITSSGTSSQQITIGSYGTGDKPILQSHDQNGIVLSGSYLTIQNIHVDGAVNAGIVDSGAHNTVQRVEVSDTGFGILAQGSFGLYTSNDVHDLHMIVNTPGGNDDYGAVAFAITGSNNEFSFNNVWNALAPSFDYGFDGGGFEFWRSSTGNYIHDNVVTNSAGFVEAGGLAGDVISDVRIENNTATDDHIFAWIHNDVSLPFGCSYTNWVISDNRLVGTSDIGSELPLGSSISYVNNWLL